LAFKVLQNGDLACGSDDYTKKILNSKNETLKRTLKGHTSGVLAFTVLHHGDFASGSADRSIKIFNPINETLKRTLNGHTIYVLHYQSYKMVI
jgi:WD40 repeat protein